MTARVTTLNNGVRVVTDSMPHLQTTSLGVWVAVGSRDEYEVENGLSHMLEHMAFKGTAKRTAQDIAEQIEALGGELNAATGHESTAYYARVLAGDEPAALEILADILLAPLFDVDEFNRERDVVLQEIAATFDTPDDITFDLLHEMAYPKQALGRPIIGTQERLRAFRTGHLHAFLKKHYIPDNIVISAAGGVDHDDLVRHAEALFGGLRKASREAGSQARYIGGVRATDHAFEQTHLAIGLPGPAYGDDQFFAAQVFAGIFGGGMSSRLFQEVREKRGLCYSIYASVWSLKDTGMTYLHAATAPDAMDELTDVIGQVFDDLRQDAPTDKEMQRAKAQLKVGLVSALESSAARAEQMARHLIGFGELLSSTYLIDRVEKVTSNDVLAYATAIGQGRPSVSVVGAGKRSQDFAHRAASRLAAS